MPGIQAVAEPGAPLPHVLLDAVASWPWPTLVVDPSTPEEPLRLANAAFLALDGGAPDGGPAAPVGRCAREWLAERLDRPAATALAQALAARRPAEVEAALHRPDGSVRQVRIGLTPARDEAGACVAFLLGFVDLTAQREAEADLDRIRAQGRGREALGQLTNSVAHEFNNVLQIFTGYVDGLRRRLGTSEDPFVQRALVRTTEAVERGATLTNRLLAHARRTRPETVPVDLAALAAGPLARARAALPEGIVLAVDLAPDLPPVTGDPLQVEVALDALLANACEALPHGGTIRLRAFRREGEPGDAGDEGAVVIEVADTGEGMSAEILARAPDPFFTTHAAGRGIGLTVVQGLMRRVSGQLGLASTPGQGTTAQLTFPIGPLRKAKGGGSG